MPLTQVGMLWDEILPTGTGGKILRRQLEIEQILGNELGPNKGEKEADRDSDDDTAEKGLGKVRVQEYGRGSLMFLVRRVDSARELDALEAAGYRFAEPRQVAGIIGSSMQIKTRNVEAKLQDMRSYAEEESSTLEPGVHLGLFAVRARVGSFRLRRPGPEERPQSASVHAAPDQDSGILASWLPAPARPPHPSPGVP